MLTYLTGKSYSDWDVVSEQPEEKYVPKEASYASIAPSIQNKPNKDKGILVATLSVVGLLSLAGFRRKKENS
jgi:hypothetical protein